MFDRSHIKSAFGKAAPHYDEGAEIQQLVLTDALALAAAHWPQNAHILDIGCGTGALHSLASNQQLKLNITGLDLAFGMCRHASKTNPQTINASAESLPFPDQSFNGCISSLMLQWAPDPLISLQEMARVTRTGGICVITSFTAGTLHELREVFATIDASPHVSTFLEPMQLSTFAVHAGFALLHAEEENFTEYYTTATALMRNIKAIGASNKLIGRNRGLMTPNTLKKIETRYKEHFGSKKKGLPATWNTTTLLLEKTP